MEIISKNGKDYLKSCILKVDDHRIEASKLFEDLEELKSHLLIDENDYYDKYGSNIIGTLKRFSCTYFSPSFMKSYMTNPAATVLAIASEEDKNDATAIGSTVHKIFEKYYQQDKQNRDQSQLDELLKETIVEGQDEKKIRSYVDGYKNIDDYLDPDKKLNDSELDCWCEYRGKTQVYIPKFNVQLPLPISYVVDRIDLRNDKLYILDYKTGYQTAKSATFDGYLSSMILYKWVIEQDFGMQVDKGYLIAPGNKDKYIPLDYSLTNESKVVDQVFTFYEVFKKNMETKYFDFTNQGYFNNANMKLYKSIMNNKDLQLFPFEVEIYIGETDKRELDVTI